MCTTIPDLHIAITGIEKVVESLADVPPLLSLLTRSATGQAISTYFNMITSPRKDGEKDGPKEVHLVYLIMVRSQAFADEELRQTLQCIRCGCLYESLSCLHSNWWSCLWHGLPGPIGKIISPHMLGLDATSNLPTASLYVALVVKFARLKYLFLNYYYDCVKKALNLKINNRK